MLSFELPRTLFKFSAQTPALLPLFQLPPEITQSMSSPYRTGKLSLAGFLRRCGGRRQRALSVNARG